MRNEVERAQAREGQNPRMNQGISRRSRGPEISPARRRPLAESESASTTGPSIKTRTSLTTVPTCTAKAPSGAVAASTCGTA